MIVRRHVIALGLSQVVCWGVSYYLLAPIADALIADTGWSGTIVYGAFSASLLAMGVASPIVGRLIDAYGGRAVMTAGSALLTIGCVALARSHSVGGYVAAWVCLGFGMRACLYDAAFATLALGGGDPRRAIAHITIAGGFASTIFWPLGHALVVAFGWRAAVLVYAAFALSTLPLHLTLPRQGRGIERDTTVPRAVMTRPRGDLLSRIAFSVVVMLTAFVQTAMSVHMIDLLARLGASSATAVRLASLRGVGQSSARLGEAALGGRSDPLSLNLLASTVLPVAYLVICLSPHPLAGGAFALLFGVSIGLHTIARGTVPLALLDARGYATAVGWLLAPGFIASAAAPLVYSMLIDRLGTWMMAVISLAIVSAAWAAAALLRYRRS